MPQVTEPENNRSRNSPHACRCSIMCIKQSSCKNSKQSMNQKTLAVPGSTTSRVPLGTSPDLQCSPTKANTTVRARKSIQRDQVCEGTLKSGTKLRTSFIPAVLHHKQTKTWDRWYPPEKTPRLKEDTFQCRFLTHAREALLES